MNTYNHLSKLFACLILIFILNSLFLIPVSAHVLKSDGSIGAVLHIDPNDDPIAGSQASFFFEFKDKTNDFNPQKCDCSFEIFESGKQIFSHPLFADNSSPSLSSSSVFFTFPKRDVYQIEVVGSPINKNSFQPFKLVWDVRVDREAIPNNSRELSNQGFFSTHIPHILIGAAAIIFLIFALMRRKKP